MISIKIDLVYKLSLTIPHLCFFLFVFFLLLLFLQYCSCTYTAIGVLQEVRERIRWGTLILLKDYIYLCLCFFLYKENSFSAFLSFICGNNILANYIRALTFPSRPLKIQLAITVWNICLSQPKNLLKTEVW